MSDHDHEHDLPQEIKDKYDEIVESATGLSPERRNLFIEEVILKTQSMIQKAMACEEPMEAKTLLGLASNSLNLAGLTNAANHDDQPDWTATGDLIVDGLWDEFIHMMTGMIKAGMGVAAVNLEDLPEETAKRFAEGEPTDEDLVLIRAEMRKSGIPIPDDAEIEFGGVVGVNKSEKPTGTGLYL